MPGPDFYGMTQDEARAWAASIGLPAFRGQQLFEGLYRPTTTRFADIPGLPADLAGRLDAQHPLAPGQESRRQESRDGTVKSLIAMADGKLVECVSIPTVDRHTICISSQVGCAVGCTFCASGQRGVERDLTAGEIVYQVVHHARLRPVTNLVFMGSGEPLFNYDNVVKAIRILAEPRGLGLGRRRFTVSTSGVPKRIRQLAEDEPQVTLALSLHAADDETRSRIVPINRRWPLADLLAAMDDYSTKVNRRMTLEYVLLAEANMTPEHADSLAAVARRYGAHVNLIPFNPVTETPHTRPTEEQVEAFVARLTTHGVNATVRGQRGADIDAACGQLKKRELVGG
ncbi:MAG TPA: 23S rRNA (adenine(2503)-C(2))-methyltransferase RlmN [Planctomycetota bacterium]|nr:23S rRNA (adenine(2503)-C(2))-methyltransferase RlmN [Planctomycetota bacterium]